MSRSFCSRRAPAWIQSSRAQAAQSTATNSVTTKRLMRSPRPRKNALKSPIVTCSSAAVTSGSATNTMVPRASRVSSNAAGSGALNCRPTTSTTVMLIIANTMTASAKLKALRIGPRTGASFISPLPAVRARAPPGSAPAPSAASRGSARPRLKLAEALLLRRLLVEHLERRHAVDALGLGFLDPLLLDRRQRLLHLGEKIALDLGDGDAELGQALETRILLALPARAEMLGQRLARDLVHRGAVLLGQRVPLLLVDDDEEALAVEAAGDDRRVLDEVLDV